MRAAMWKFFARTLEATEGFLAVVFFLYAALILFVPQQIATYPGMIELFRKGLPIWAMSIPFLTKSTLCGIGIWCDVYNPPPARLFHLAGVLLGSFLWGWFLYQLCLIDRLGSLGGAVGITACIANVFIVGKVLAKRGYHV